MTEIVIGLHLEGTATDIADFEAFLKATKQLDFPTLAALLSRMTKVAITKISATTTTVATITEDMLYTTPTTP